tara:strand:- start:227 stop:343 length:117 start_codon:yes stop_codon:yes gene_type:complete
VVKFRWNPFDLPLLFPIIITIDGQTKSLAFWAKETARA